MKLATFRVCALVALLACLLLPEVEARCHKKHKHTKHCKKHHKKHPSGKAVNYTGPIERPTFITDIDAMGIINLSGEITVCPPGTAVRCDNCTDNAALRTACLGLTCTQKSTWNSTQCELFVKLPHDSDQVCDCDHSSGFFQKSADDSTCVKC